MLKARTGFAFSAVSPQLYLPVDRACRCAVLPYSGSSGSRSRTPLLAGGCFSARCLLVLRVSHCTRTLLAWLAIAMMLAIESRIAAVFCPVCAGSLPMCTADLRARFHSRAPSGDPGAHVFGAPGNRPDMEVGRPLMLASRRRFRCMRMGSWTRTICTGRSTI